MLFLKGVLIKGKIFKIESKDYYLLDESGHEVRCYLRGKFKKEFGLKDDKLFAVDIAVVGDVVEFNKNSDGTGVITKIFPRQNYISRKAPRIKGASARGERLEQIIASNIDNLVIVCSVRKPEFNNRTLDRIIVVGESSHVNILIVINKMDLDTNSEAKRWANRYREIGYSVFETSVVNKTGLDELKENLSGKVNLFWGPSGVGKSSILNLLYPSLGLKVGEVSNYSSKGKHTTVTSLLKKAEPGTYIIDTPGIREIDPYGIREEDLGHYFIEFSRFAAQCRFNTCTHNHEPGCAVIEAVEAGDISRERYQSYLNMLATIEEDINF